MKTLGIFAVVALLLLAGCGFRSTKVRARVVSHKQEAGGAYYELRYEVLTPTNLAGLYGSAATSRSDLITNVNGGEYEVYLNFTMIGTLSSNSADYDVSPPRGKDGDFLEMAKRVK